MEELTGRTIFTSTNEIQICDVIKQNESELANIDLEIESNKGSKSFCFLLF